MARLAVRPAETSGPVIPADARRPFIMAGPCVIEGESMALAIAEKLRIWTAELNLALVFKASYLKANRTASDSFEGPGVDEGLRILARVRREFDVPILTDVHCTAEVKPVAEVADILQIPAFLCRQSGLIRAAAGAGRALNIKKGQFLAMDDMRHVVAKARSAAPDRELFLTERGSCFGYHDLVVDMRAIAWMRTLGGRVVFDATHALQHPGIGGDRRFARPLARAALGAGAEGIFAEVHPEPERARSDASTQLPLAAMRELLSEWSRLAEMIADLEQHGPGGLSPERGAQRTK